MLKVKNTKKVKKIIAMLLLVLTIFSTAQPIFAVSSSGTGNWVPGQWDSGVFTTDNKTSVGILIRRLVNTTTGEKLTVFCAEHGVDSTTGEVDTATHIKPTDPRMKEASKIAYFGWYQKYGDYVVDGGIMAESMSSRKMDYVFTQQMIWETLGQSSATFRNSSIQSQYQSFKAEINSKMNQMKTKPSFSDTTVTVEVGETTTLTDNNGVLADYSSIDKTVNEIRFVHTKGQNTLNITVGENCTIENYRVTDEEMKSWGLIKEETRDHDTTVYFQFKEGVQNQLYAMNYNDPVSMSLGIKINLFGSLELSKLNKNGDLVNGAKFNITGPDGYNQDIVVSNGKITIERLKRGTYTIREISAPYGYLLDTKSYNVEVKANQKATQAVVNEEPTGTFTLIKKNSSKTANLKGAEYRIWNDNYDQTLTTNEEGKIEVSGLKLGKYNYKETKAPEGYLIDEKTYSFEIKYKDQNTAVIYESAERTDDEPTGEIGLIKTDKETGNENRVDGTSHHGDAQIKGAVYTLYAKTDILNKAKTIKYFSKDDSIATFTFNEYGVASIKIINNATSAEISVDGDILKGLPMGSYYAKETTVPTGYTQDTNIYDYTLSFKDSKTKVVKEIGTVINTVEKAPFEVIKVTTNDNTTAEVVGGAEFTAILTKYVKFYGSFDEAKKHLSEFAEDEYSIFTTGTDGHGISGLLAYGDYTVNETYTPSPEIETVEEFYVTIDKNSKTPIKELVENDLPFEAYIKLEKKDKDTGKYVTYSNATFSLYKLNEETSAWERVQCKVGKDYFDSWTTDENGVARTEEKLEAGTYKVEEIKIPTGFIELDGELRFEVNNKNKTLNYDKDFDAWITVTINNQQPTGTIKLKKSVDLREDTDKTLIKDIDYTKISFELVVDENVIDYADGSTIYEKGKVLGTYNLNKDGTLTITDLPMGKYHLKELTTIEGAVLDETEHKVVFTQTDTKTKEYVVELNIENKTTAIKISKQDITGEKELAGAKLTVLDENNEIIDSWTSTEKAHIIEGLQVGKTYTLREEIAPDFYVVATEIQFTVQNVPEVQTIKMIDKIVEMSKIDIGGNEIEGAELKVLDKNGEIVDSWVSSKEPHKIKGLKEGETYTLVEDYAPNGYVVSNSIEFTVTSDKETQNVQMIDKVVEVSKEDIAGNELEGATLVVTSKKTKNIVDKWVSTTESHKVSGLIEGETYVLTEEIAIDGYVKATSIEFTVTSEKETQKVIMIDKILEVVKTDFVTGEEIEGAELKVIDEDGNVIDEWTSSKEPHRVKGLEENKKYKLVEVTAPYGYEITEEIEFTVSEDKATQRIEIKDMPILQDIKLVKIDSNTKETIKDKFTFGIYEDAECTKLIKEVKSDKETGTVLFEDLRYGTYFIKEIAAPKGYVLSDRVIKVEMSDKGVFIDDTKVEGEDFVYTFEFENTPVDTPKTGDNGNLKVYASLLGLSLIALASVGVHEYKKRKSVNKK